MQRRISRQCAGICGIGRRRIRAGMAWTNLSPRKGGTRTRQTKRKAPQRRARVQCCVLIITCIVSSDSFITIPPFLCIRHSLSFVLASWPPTYESDRQTDISTFFDLRSQLYPYTKTLPLENAQVITLLDNQCPPAKQQPCSTACVYI